MVRLPVTYFLRVPDGNHALCLLSHFDSCIHTSPIQVMIDLVYVPDTKIMVNEVFPNFITIMQICGQVRGFISQKMSLLGACSILNIGVLSDSASKTANGTH